GLILRAMSSEITFAKKNIRGAGATARLPSPSHAAAACCAAEAREHDEVLPNKTNNSVARAKVEREGDPLPIFRRTKQTIPLRLRWGRTGGDPLPNSWRFEYQPQIARRPSANAAA